eukprot:sb/3466399/
MSTNTSPVSQRKRSITPASSPGGVVKKQRFEEEGTVETFQNRLSELINKLNEDRETDQATMSARNNYEQCLLVGRYNPAWKWQQKDNKRERLRVPKWCGRGRTVILNEGDQKNAPYYMDMNDNSTLHLQIDTAEGPRIIPISGQHVITMADGQQFLAGGVLTEEQPGYLHTVEGGQTFIINTEHGGQQIYQDSNGQQYIICDVPGAEHVQPTVSAEDSQFTNIDSYISKTPVTETEERSQKPVVRLPNGPGGEFITYEVDCQPLAPPLTPHFTGGLSAHPLFLISQVDCQLEDGSEDKNILDQEKLANLLNVLQTGEHGHALSNADLFILAPPDQVSGSCL